MINHNNITEIYRTEFNGKLMRRIIQFNDLTPLDEKLIVEISYCRNEYGNWMPEQWHKQGYINHVLKSYICLNTDAEEENGMCRRRYDPTIKLSPDGKRFVINFQWIMEISEENEKKLLQEVARMANNGIMHY